MRSDATAPAAAASASPLPSSACKSPPPSRSSRSTSLPSAVVTTLATAPLACRVLSRQECVPEPPATVGAAGAVPSRTLASAAAAHRHGSRSDAGESESGESTRTCSEALRLFHRECGSAASVARTSASPSDSARICAHWHVWSGGAPGGA
eukprot:2226881-Pleurochrysis_carterae.AAC.2